MPQTEEAAGAAVEMIRIAVLETQKDLRDLGGLPRVCDEVRFCNAQALSETSDPAVIVGVWLVEEPDTAKQLIARRSASGLATFVVPRFRAGDLRSVLKAPSSVRVKIGEFEAFQWDDDSLFTVPGQTVIDTSLHAGRWGEVAGLGVTVLSYRPHEAAGAIVLCTAGLTSRPFGVDVDEQRRLLGQMLARSGNSLAEQAIGERQTIVAPAASINDILAIGSSNAATVALLVAACGGSRDCKAVASAAKTLGFALTDETISQTLALLPDVPLTDVESALREYGWGAFLRRGRSVLEERG
jgi:hypothetical protein